MTDQRAPSVDHGSAARTAFIGAGRVIGGVPIGRPRIRAASLAYAVTASSLYLLVAIVVRRALP